MSPSRPQAHGAAANDGEQEAAAPATTDATNVPDPAELAFLVTHWLAGTSFAAAADNNDDDDEDWEKKEAERKIRRAASDLASAFATLGTFGTAARPLLASQEFMSLQPPERTATFSDWKRKWPCPPNQLDRLVQASSAATLTADAQSKRQAALNLVQSSAEVVLAKTRNPAQGRTLREAIAVDGSAAGDNATSTTAVAAAAVPIASSSLQTPVLLTDDLKNEKPAAETAVQAPVESSSSQVLDCSALSAEASRHYLDLRAQCLTEKTQTQSLQASLALHQRSWQELQQQRVKLQEDGGANLEQMAIVEQQEQNCQRATATLQRQLQNRQPVHVLETKVATAKAAAERAFGESKTVLANFRGPAAAVNVSHNRIVFNLVHRQLGLDRMGGTSLPRSMGRLRSSGLPTETGKALLFGRLAHAATVNTHLSYPVYCLKFDRTGQYFATGADDYLVKVFSVGGNMPSTRSKTRPSSFVRGPVLVCTLRGHAGVINDIDVSSDNGFLATASEDGDCRIWGLKDGRPVAILRGHVGGANMVAWSKLTPYRLVTTAADGLARTWDIREACLKRYGGVIGKRPEYRRREKQGVLAAETSDALVGSALRAPPLPLRDGQGGDAPSAGAAVALPPLPAAAAAVAAPPVAAGQGEAAGQGNQNEINPGAFVANATIDEGVKLLAKLQHGAVLDEQANGPGTRSRRAAVKVICVARCPHGGHFATGSDDGVCRVWQDEDDPAVESSDKLLSAKPCITPSLFGVAEKPPRTAPTTRRMLQSDRLLLTLKGHLGAITDLQYSHAGDRILTGSQKDGVVRIWSWGMDRTPSSSGQSQSHRDAPGGQSSHILIKLTNPNSSASSNGQASGRRPRRTPTSKISCDVAAWICDDTKIVTSQCELVKQSTSEAVAGSQFIFLWDSYSGNCLLGISEAHKMQCPVVIPHPTDATILCTAGADGFAKLWDWETGRCTFSHQNTVDFGPVETNERGKSSGYLEGAFFPDGAGLVLTDDSGRVSIFDTFEPKRLETKGANPTTWVKEQYFANDYYELLYDSNGYCIEKGCEQPPHLAPRGVRCSHSGAPWAGSVNERFKGLSGPLPISLREARANRQLLRVKAGIASERHSNLRGNIVAQYDPRATILIGQSMGAIAPVQVQANGDASGNEAGAPSGSSNAAAARPNSRLSSNYRWRDYVDLLHEEGNDEDEPDSDDEEFQLNERRAGPSAFDDSESDEDDDALGHSDSEDDVEERPSRVSERLPDRRRYTEADSEEDAEYMSTNNTPSGPFTPDYETHFFRMSSNAAVRRQWLLRMESNSSYCGRKSYTPQVGDSVVYIPRAHHETISVFPSLPAPWQSWPLEAVWPVVRCSIRNIRYRFPYKAYYSQSGREDNACKSVVAILFLELTGIPQLSQDRTLEWPDPSFVTPHRSHTFEISVFENDQADFVIPIGLYTARLRSLERALSGGTPSSQVEHAIESYYADENSPRDSELTPFKGLVKGHASPNDDSSNNDPNLYGSGYHSLIVHWEDGSIEKDSPWEVNLSDPGKSLQPDRPSLTEEEKKRVLQALNDIKGLPGVDEYFMTPVDESRYSDYSSRVEVPVNLTLITNRLEAGYYGTRSSVVADIKLIRENCAKYNGPHDELTDNATDMVAKFEELVLSGDELVAYHNFEAAVVANLSLIDVPAGNRDAEISVETSTSLRSTRPRRIVRAPSSLEQLPSQPTRSVGQRTGRRLAPTRRTRSAVDTASSASRSSARRSGRSVLESAAPGQRTLRRAARAPGNAMLRQQEPLDRASRRTRGNLSEQPESLQRSLRHSSRGDRAATNRSHSQRHSGRRVSHGASYVDQPSDVDESDDELLDTSPLDPPEPPPPASRSTTSRQSRALRSTAPDIGSRSQRHSSRAAAPSASYADQPSDVDESDESSSPVHSDGDQEESRQPFSEMRPTRSGGSRKQTRQNRRRSSVGTDNDEDSDMENVHDSESDEVVPSDEDDDSSSSEEDESKRVSPRRRKRNRSISSESPRRSSARASRQTYANLSESESEAEEEVAQTKAPAKSRRRTPATKRRKASPSGPASKKRRGNAAVKVQVRAPLKVWPTIDIKKITEVTQAILTQLGELDEQALFAEPVADAFPEVALAYSAIVTNPMDFQTIKEDRLRVYQSVAELQHDLILVFDNCIAFNGGDSEFGQMALLMLNSLDEVFSDACSDLNVLLPRRW